jgi:hypothetical protein
MFFGAEDRRAGRTKVEEKVLAPERGYRQGLAEHVITEANHLINAVRTLRAFDRTGNAEMALDHLQRTLLDLRRHTANLVDEVKASVDRCGANDAPPMNSAAVVEPIPQAPAAADQTKPAEPKLRIIHDEPVHIEPRITPLTMIKSIDAALTHAGRNRAGR